MEKKFAGVRAKFQNVFLVSLEASLVLNNKLKLG